MKRLYIVMIFNIILVLFVGCKSKIDSNLLSQEDIKLELQNEGYQVSSEKTDKDILEGKRYWLTLDDNEHLGVYVYESADKASEDASYLDSDGSTYSNPSSILNVDWISYPHFYQKENIIILYVGESEEIIGDLTELYGEVFAGMRP